MKPHGRSGHRHGRPGSHFWQRLLAPLLLVAVGLAALCLHVTHLDHQAGMPGSHPSVTTSTSTAHADHATPRDKAQAMELAIGPQQPGTGDAACGMGGCAVPGDLPGAAVMLCLALLPGLAVGLLLLRRPDKVQRWMRRLVSGSPPTPAQPIPVAPTPFILCVLRT